MWWDMTKSHCAELPFERVSAERPTFAAVGHIFDILAFYFLKN